MKKLLMMIGAAAVAVGANAAAAWDTDTVYSCTVDGITYRYIMDEDGAQIGLYSTSGTNEGSIIPTSTTGVFHVPATLTHTDGVAYNVTAFPYHPFYNCSLTGLVFPETDSFAQINGSYGKDTGGKQFFDKMQSVIAIWWKGPSTVASGDQPLAKLGRTTNTFRDDKALRVVVLGPNVTYNSNGGSSYPLFTGLTGVTAFVPKSRWTNIDDTIFGGTDCKIVRYGPGEDIDVSIDGTFTVATSNRLGDVLSVANDLHTYCGMNPKINVTNVIEVADGMITAEKLAFLDNGTFNSLVFKVTTQAQLDTLLAAIPSSVPFAINPADAKVELTVPQGREVYVKLSAEGRQGKYTPKINGLTITFY